MALFLVHISLICPGDSEPCGYLENRFSNSLSIVAFRSLISVTSLWIKKYLLSDN